MAQIKINSKIVIEACEKAIIKKSEFLIDISKVELPFSPDLSWLKDNLSKCKRIKILAEYSESRHSLDFYLDHDDFNLIGEFLPKPKTYPVTTG